MSKHKTIIMGSIRRKTYDAGIYINGLLLQEYEQLVERQPIWTGELDYIAEQYDKIYIDELDVEVKVVAILKTTHGIIYHTDYTIELIEDSLSEESKREAEKKYNILSKRLQEAEEKRKNKGSKFFENFFNFLFNKPID